MSRFARNNAICAVILNIAVPQIAVALTDDPKLEKGSHSGVVEEIISMLHHHATEPLSSSLVVGTITFVGTMMAERFKN